MNASLISTVSKMLVIDTQILPRFSVKEKT